MVAKLSLACVVLLLSSAASAQRLPTIGLDAPPAAEQSTLGWMTGDWETGNPTDGLTIEHWEPMRGGTKLGLSQTTRGRVARGFEYMRIVRHAEGLVFYGSPDGASAVAFAQASLIERPAEGAYEIVFVNPDHDYPTRISYRLAGETGDMLVAETSGRNPRTDTMTWQYRRIR